VKIAILSDTHFCADRGASVGTRRTGIADILLLRAVHRLNRYIKPDITLVLGDLVNDGTASNANELLQRLKKILDLLDSPTIVLPGNHDGDPAAFQRFFPLPSAFLDVEGVRFVAFVDPEEPGYMARRTAPDLARLAAARQDWSGPIVAVQHVPLLPPKRHDCPYNYVNAEAILACMKTSGVNLAISGHYHPGIDLLEDEGVSCVVAPALCESPFSFLTLAMTGEQVAVTRHALKMPPELHLTDAHVHTSLAYCNENMDVAMSLRLAEDFGLAGIRVTEHSGHLYFDRKGYGTCARDGMASARPECSRLDRYLEVLDQAACPQPWRGIEIDCCFDGSPLSRAADLEHFPFRIGAMHQMAGLLGPNPGPAGVSGEFLATLERFLQTGIQALAHPFRVFRRAGQPTPAELYAPTVQLLRKFSVAAEINFHTNDPSPEFVRLCIEGDVPLMFGSDAHNLYEVGELTPHLDLLERAGYDGDVKDVLLNL